MKNNLPGTVLIEINKLFWQLKRNSRQIVWLMYTFIRLSNLHKMSTIEIIQKISSKLFYKTFLLFCSDLKSWKEIIIIENIFLSNFEQKF